GDRDQRGHRRAAPAGRYVHRHAAHAHEGVGGDQPGEGRAPVIPPEFDYVAPDTLDEVLTALRGDEDAKVLAGGHSLLPLMKLRLAAPTMLVDIRKVPGLRGFQ